MDVLSLVSQLAEQLPHFPDGRIDYSTSPVAPVLNLVVSFENKVLLLKRSEQVLEYKGKWNSLGGYLDEVKAVEDKMYEELYEELKIAKDMVKRLTVGETREVQDHNIGRTWYIVPGLAELQTLPAIQLDFEHTEFAWVLPEEVSMYDTVPGLDKLILSFQ